MSVSVGDIIGGSRVVEGREGGGKKSVSGASFVNER